MAAMNMNQEQFKQLIREEKPVLVDFWAPWCGHCRRIGPAYEKIGEEYADSLAVGKINIDEEPRLAGGENRHSPCHSRYIMRVTLLSFNARELL